MGSDLDRLQQLIKEGRFLPPSPHVPNVVDLARALGILGDAPGTEVTAGAVRLSEVIGTADHLIFIVADGLGMNLIEALPAGAFLRCHLACELRTVFPSSSAVALTSLATGCWPSDHGVTGWWTHLPEIRGAAVLLQFITRAGSRPLASLGVGVEQALPAAAVMASMRRDASSFFPSPIAGSVSSRYFGGRRPVHAYGSLAQGVDCLLQRVARAPGPTYTYLYTPRIDHEAHQFGIHHHAVAAALDEIETQVARLSGGLGSRGRIVLTADHGMLDTPVASKHRFRFSGPLADALEWPPSGDSRVLFLHARPGREDQVRACFHERYRDRFLLLSVDEAEAAGLFGPRPLTPALRPRFGSFVAISAGLDAVEYVPERAAPRFIPYIAHHSGLTPEEMRVPLVVA